MTLEFAAQFLKFGTTGNKTQIPKQKVSVLILFKMNPAQI